MYPLLLDLHAAGRRRGLLTAQLRYRVVGWNAGDPVEDVGSVLERLRRVHGDVPIALVGHSMGARACLRAAGGVGVVAVAALAPWCPPNEPVAQLAGRTLMVAHGLDDRVTRPDGSRLLVERAEGVAARLCRFEVRREGHAMLRRPLLWQRLTRRFVLGALGRAPLDPQLARAFAAPLPDRWALPL